MVYNIIDGDLFFICNMGVLIFCNFPNHGNSSNFVGNSNINLDTAFYILRVLFIYFTPVIIHIKIYSFPLFPTINNCYSRIKKQTM